MNIVKPYPLCITTCEEIPRDRNRYFPGKYLTPRDLQAEQAYFLSRLRLHNRLFVGWGIVCGLNVRQHDRPECRDRWIIVDPGIAIDCCGRELFLCESVAIELPEPCKTEAKYPPGEKPREDDRQQSPAPAKPDEARQEVLREPPEKEQGPDASPDERGKPSSEDARSWGPYVVCLEYCEKEIECVPVLLPDCGCDPSQTAANRVRELSKIKVRRLSDLDPACWPRSGKGPDTCEEICSDKEKLPGWDCFEPDCPCGNCVPLALLTCDPSNPKHPIVIDLSGRREVPTAGAINTRIIHYNWPHGGDLSLEDLLNMDNGKLRVRFSRPLKAAEGNATGINRHTFFAMYGEAQGDLEFLPFEDPPTLEDDCTAVLSIDESLLGIKKGRLSIAESYVYVTLRGDFILDCNGQPVDATHRGGRYPTGNGISGGDFVSWFHVVSS